MLFFQRFLGVASWKLIMVEGTTGFRAASISIPEIKACVKGLGSHLDSAVKFEPAGSTHILHLERLRVIILISII